ncbi:MAG TPA: MFS transporter [Actinomycetota bacterium]
MASTLVPGDLTAPLESQPPRRSLWGHGDFVRRWGGQTISLLGSQITLLALPLTAILVFKALAFQVGTLSTVEFLPFMLLGLPVGVWVDRFRRRRILVAADVLRLVVIGSVPLAYALGVLRLAQLYVVGFLSGIGTVFFDVAYGAYLPALVDRTRLVEGNAKRRHPGPGRRSPAPASPGSWSRRCRRRAPCWPTRSATWPRWCRSCRSEGRSRRSVGLRAVALRCCARWPKGSDSSLASP